MDKGKYTFSTHPKKSSHSIIFVCLFVFNVILVARLIDITPKKYIGLLIERESESDLTLVRIYYYYFDGDFDVAEDDIAYLDDGVACLDLHRRFQVTSHPFVPLLSFLQLQSIRGHDYYEQLKCCWFFLWI